MVDSKVPEAGEKWVNPRAKPKSVSFSIQTQDWNLEFELNCHLFETGEANPGGGRSQVCSKHEPPQVRGRDCFRRLGWSTVVLFRPECLPLTGG